MSDTASLRAAIGAIHDPHLDQSLDTSGAVRGLVLEGGRAAVELRLDYPAAGWHATLEGLVREAALALPGVEAITVDVRSRVLAHKVREGLAPLPEVKNVLAVASGKGGVGKSTTAVNLALALAAEGARVGVLDADIYGPSIPAMLGLSGKPETEGGRSILPMHAHGLQAMSIGVLVDQDTPMIWRGPMATQALQQLLTDTRWDALDYLVIDLPPGTGDIQLTLSQRVPVSGAVIVTTPQEIATLDARKALQMFRKVEVPVLGIVENMGVHVCSQCGHAEHVFGEGGGAWMAEAYGVPLLGSLPLDLAIRRDADGGRPSVAADPASAISQAYRLIARRTAARLAQQARNKAIAFPSITVSNT